MIDNAELIRLCRCCDQGAMNLLYRTYAPRMLELVLRYVTDRHAAEDILHDGFVIIFSRIGQVRDASRLEHWMGIIMINLARRYLRQSGTLIHAGYLDSDFPDEKPSVDPKLSASELAAFMDRLPEGYRKVFDLAVLQGKSHREIGSLLGIAANSSSSQLARAKAFLRRLIAGNGLLLLFLVATWLISRKETPAVSVPQSAPDVLLAIACPQPDAVATMPVKAGHRHSAVDSVSRPPVASPDSVAPDSVAPVAVPVADELVIASVGNITGRPIAAVPVRLPSAASRWSISLSASGVKPVDAAHGGRPAIGTPPDPTAPTPPPAPVVEKRRRSYISYGISAAYDLSSRWSIESGLRYSYVIYGHNECSNMAGLTLKLNYKFLDFGRASVYATVGSSVDVSFLGTSWVCVGSFAGLGAQYQFTRSVSIYAEPTFGIDWRDLRLSTSLSCGVRFRLGK